MKTNNMTEIKIDQLVTVTGGYVDAVGPVNAGVRVKAVGPVAYPYKAEIKSCDPPLKETGPLEWYDSTKDETGPLNYPYLTALIDWRADYPYKENRFGVRV